MIINQLAFDLNPNKIVDINELDGLSDFKKFAWWLILTLLPSDLEVTRKADIYINAMNINFELVLETLLHTL